MNGAASMWSVERAHPWLLLLYAVAFVAAAALSALWPLPWWA